MNARRLLPLLLAGALAGCGASRSTGDGIARSDTGPRDRNVFTLEDIHSAQTQNIGNVLDMIRRYRPEWLRPTLLSNSGRLVDPTAWLDRQRIGTATALRSIPLSAATLVRYLTPSEAQGTLGLDNLGGAIVVSTR